MSFAAVLCVMLLAPQQPDLAALQHELALVVDLPTANARGTAVDELLKKHPATLDDWLAACRTFGAFAALEPGQSKQTVDLQVLDKVEPTDVFLFVPKGYDPTRPAPLLLWGHGTHGSGAREYLQWQALADQLGMLVLAITEFDANEGWRFEPRERASQLAALRWARRTANVEENAIFVGGWSRGGHMTWDLVLRFPDLFAGALPVVGGPRLQLGAQNNLRYLENLATMPMRDLQGAQDDKMLLSDLHLAFARLKKWNNADATLTEFPDRGHDADLAAVDWVAFFAKRRTPMPSRVVRLAAEPTETRAWWLQSMTFTSKVDVAIAPPVDAQQWARLDEAGQRALVLDKLADYTARLAIKDLGHGRFVAEGRNVKSFTLVLTAEQLGKDGALDIKLQSRSTKKTATPDASVLLHEFVERFDRTFLPIARVVVP